METTTLAVETDRELVLNALYLLSNTWLKKIEFLEDEVRVFQNLLQCHFNRVFPLSEPRREAALGEQLQSFIKQKNVILDKIFCHQSNLKACIEGLMDLCEDYLLKENAKLEDMVNNLQEIFAKLRQQIVNLNHEK